jgi:hypothetical protein
MRIVRNNPACLALYLIAAIFGAWLSIDASAPARLKADAVCSDGWVSDSEGSGTCSHHGGVSRWAPGPNTWPPGMHSPTGDSFRSSPDPRWGDMTPQQRVIGVLVTALGSIALGAVLAWIIWIFSIAFGGLVEYSAVWAFGSAIVFGVGLYQLIH